MEPLLRRQRAMKTLKPLLRSQRPMGTLEPLLAVAARAQGNTMLLRAGARRSQSNDGAGAGVLVHVIKNVKPATDEEPSQALVAARLDARVHLRKLLQQRQKAIHFVPLS